MYVGALLSNNGKNDQMDNVYGVYFDDNGTIFGDKQFDVDVDDSIIVDGIRYVGTPGLYELIFKKISNNNIYTQDDKRTYKKLLLTTNAHRCSHDVFIPIMGNKGYKYKYIISPLLFAKRPVDKRGGGIPSAMRLTNKEIDYVHWDDPKNW